MNVGAPILYKMVVDAYNVASENALSFDTPMGAIMTTGVALILACEGFICFSSCLELVYLGAVYDLRNVTGYKMTWKLVI